MLKAINKSIISRYNTDAKNDILKIIGIHVFIILGLLTGLIMFTLDMTGYSTSQCLPGDVTILILFGVALYGLRHIHLAWAINIFFLVPIIPYFFFISNSFAIIPTHQSVPNTLWTLISFFLFFLIFSDKKRDLILFFGISFLTLILHTYQAGLTDLLFRYRWETDTVYTNPFITLSGYFLISLLLSWRFQNTINELIEQNENTEKTINQTIRNLPQGMMHLEIVKDEFGSPSHLEVRRTNLAFERMFKITSRELKDQAVSDVFPKIFRGSFDWNKEYLHSKKTHFSFYLERLDKYFEVDTFKISNNQIISLFVDATSRERRINELEENKQRYQALLEAIPDLFFIIDKDGVYVDFVFKASEALKIKPDDIIGNSIFEVGFSEKMSSKIFQCIQQCIEFDSIETIEYALEVEGSSAMFEMRIARLNDHSVVSLARDITSRKMAELKMEEAKNKAVDADR